MKLRSLLLRGGTWVLAAFSLSTAGRAQSGGLTPVELCGDWPLNRR